MRAEILFARDEIIFQSVDESPPDLLMRFNTLQSEFRFILLPSW